MLTQSAVLMLSQTYVFPPGINKISSNLTISQSISVTTEVSYSSLLAEYNFELYYIIDKNYNCDYESKTYRSF